MCRDAVRSSLNSGWREVLPGEDGFVPGNRQARLLLEFSLFEGVISHSFQPSFFSKTGCFPWFFDGFLRGRIPGKMGYLDWAKHPNKARVPQALHAHQERTNIQVPPLTCPRDPEIKRWAIATMTGSEPRSALLGLPLNSRETRTN